LVFETIRRIDVARQAAGGLRTLAVHVLERESTSREVELDGDGAAALARDEVIAGDALDLHQRLFEGSTTSFSITSGAAPSQLTRR
jgi:hypothetical protein